MSDYLVILASRNLLYSAFQNLFGIEPSRAALDNLCSECMQQAFSLLGRLDESDESDGRGRESAYKQELGLLNGHLATYGQDKDSFIDRLSSEYTRLFIGPNSLPAPPWESAFVSPTRTLFSEKTLEVREAFLRQGFLPTEYRKESDDHLALEAGFMAALASRSVDEYETQGEDAATGTLLASCEFLEKHLLEWLPLFCAALSRDSAEGFYSVAARLFLAFTNIDLMLLGELVKEIGAQ